VRSKEKNTIILNEGIGRNNRVYIAENFPTWGRNNRVYVRFMRTGVHIIHTHGGRNNRVYVRSKKRG